MRSIIVCSIKLLYRYICKHYFVMLFMLLLIITIVTVCEVFISCTLNKKNYNKMLLIKKQESHQFEIMKNGNFFNSVVIRSNILKKHWYCNKSSRDINMYNYTVSQDDVLSRILIEYSRNGIDASEITLLLQQYPILRQIKIGQILSWIIITKKKLQCLIWDIFPQEIRVYNRMDASFTEGIIKVSNQLHDGLSSSVLFIGELSKTFIDSARSLGIDENCIIDITTALQYQLDFQRLHQGDRFSVLTSIMMNDDHSVRSKLLGARLYTSGKNYYVFRANNGKLYDREAVRLGGNFMRFPTLKPFRVSSNFNLNRLNPVTGQVSPHSGVDFAVPIGTPVISVGDGEVIVSTYSKIAGNYVTIRHNCHCITRYMHLKKLLVKPGQKVKLGDSIALSGNTGRSTGPHLHFEIWINHRPVNPLTTTLLDIEKLLGNERTIYLNQVKEILPQLRFD
ncbi:murein DD-endopeptidase MepM [Blochmannia endosymbiont of Camponotus sp. C-003]|uniref:murein DD-endopeptidase MepM n=1 Tax=unclassified Candidatus Blochmanniella TaxID=711328 RepID=UPI002025A61F|nr:MULTISPECIES: murein DD-endopeptidase MepM [unclassified Candidatus Blochmannia]URJ23374.1 murein DD-endopeptidase MepM [Blochmannia endosymbiont of Camponotus sp. C-003]URJ28847.1 murein DD-endopeptidase MepM [Blochmannia endosymbiont of Camponotus sp. C-046]